MSHLPAILVTDGWETDQNDMLEEIIIPGTVDTLNAPAKVTFGGETLNYVPSTAAALQEFEAPSVLSLTASLFAGYTALESIAFNNLSSVKCPATAYAGVFHSCTRLTAVSLPSLRTIDDYTGKDYSGTFYGCSSLESISLPSLTSITALSGGGGTFKGCSALKSVQFGSEGNPVTYLGNSGYVFNGCTQSGLTITIYTSGGEALSGEPWGATNATIVYEEA